MDFLPLALTVPVVSLLIGLCFGFVLESSGFGDSRRLAAQFYFTEMRVLKVMFTAIVVCMLGLVWIWSMGLLDFDRIDDDEKRTHLKNIATSWTIDRDDVDLLRETARELLASDIEFQELMQGLER